MKVCDRVTYSIYKIKDDVEAEARNWVTCGSYKKRVDYTTKSYVASDFVGFVIMTLYFFLIFFYFLFFLTLLTLFLSIL